MNKDEKAKDIIKSLDLGPEQTKLAEKAYQHTKTCELCRLLAMMVDQIILKHIEEHEESLR